jgi:short-subunit dehydrogenase
MKPLSEHVVVVTGASSGVGRETARLLGERGATVVLSARNEEALQSAAEEVRRLGGKALVHPADVSSWDQVEGLRDRAVAEFGAIDTWVNSAAVAVYGTVVDDLSAEEIHRVVEVTQMGQIYGMKVAAEQMRDQGSGVIVNVASALGRRSVPLQAPYCAAKHAVVGFAESLRMELAREAPGVHVTTLLPSSINTPLFVHARSKMQVLPMPIPPIYEPRVVAKVVAEVAETPRRDVVVGGGGKMLTAMQRVSPALADAFMLGPGKAFAKQKTDEPDNGKDNLFAPMGGSGSVTGQFGEKSKSTSVYTEQLEMHPGRQRSLLAAVAVLVFLSARRSGRR